MDSFTETIETGRSYPGVNCIPGMEATVNTEQGPIDIVCLGFTFNDAEELEQPVISKYREWMREHNQATLNACRKLGIRFDRPDLEELLAKRPEHIRKLQGEVRIANESLRSLLISKKIISTNNEYPSLVQKLMETVSFPQYPSASDILPILAGRAAVLSIAHPGRMILRMGQESFGRFVKDLGLNAIEAGHSTHSLELKEAYVSLCKKLQMIPTAGTDSHNPDDYKSNLGQHKGDDNWDKAVLDAIQKFKKY